MRPSPHTRASGSHGDGPRAFTRCAGTNRGGRTRLRRFPWKQRVRERTPQSMFRFPTCPASFGRVWSRAWTVWLGRIQRSTEASFAEAQTEKSACSQEINIFEKIPVFASIAGVETHITARCNYFAQVEGVSMNSCPFCLASEGGGGGI